MEFLMTYGWVILVVLSAVGVVVHFGVMNPSNFEEESCSFPIDLICSDFVVQSNSGNGSIKLVVINSLGDDIKVSSIIAINSDLFDTNCSWNVSGGVLLENDKNLTFVLNETNGRKGDLCKIDSFYVGKNKKTDWDLKLSWYSVNADKKFTHPVFGHLVAQVES